MAEGGAAQPVKTPFYKMKKTMRALPENLTDVWSDAKRDLLTDHPELSNARAGELAAARVFNWFYEDWTAFRDQLRAEFMTALSAGGMDAAKQIDPQRLQLYGEMLEWTPLQELRDLSGSRTLLRDLDNRIVTEKSTPPAELIAIENHWRTERIADPSRLQTLEDLKQAWGVIDAEFRGHKPGRGSLYTNHQGLHAIQTAFERIFKISFGDHVGGITVSLYSAGKAIEYFGERAEELGGKAGKNLERLADLFKEAITNAQANNEEGISVIDTTFPGNGSDSPFDVLRKSWRHEALHRWEYKIDLPSESLLSGRMIKADPDYPMLKQRFSLYYENITPGQIASEAMATVVSGDWKEAGFIDEEQALRFIDRCFSNVVLRYGKWALDSLRLPHPSVKEVIDNVRSIPIRELRTRRTARDVEGGSQSAGEGEESDRKTPRDRSAIRATQSRLAGGGIGEDAGSLRRDGAEPSAIRSTGQGINLPGVGSDPGSSPSRDLQSQKEYSAAKFSQAAEDSGLTKLPGTISSHPVATTNGSQLSQERIGAGPTTASFDGKGRADREDLLTTLAEAQGIAEYERQLANLERSSPDDNHAQEQSLELEDGEDHSISF